MAATVLSNPNILIQTNLDLISFLGTPADARSHIRKLILGPWGRRVAHRAQSPLEVSDSKALGAVIISTPSLIAVKCGDVHWPVFELLGQDTSTSRTSSVFIILPVWPWGLGLEDTFLVDMSYAQHGPLAIPANPYLLDNGQGDESGIEPSDVRVARVITMPLHDAAAYPLQVMLGEHNVEGFHEVVVHVAGDVTAAVPATVKRPLQMVGRYVVDLSIRWVDLQDIMNLEVVSMRQHLRIDTCVALTSLTLTTELIEGQPWIGQKQWNLNLSLLEEAPAQSLRRVQLCVIFSDEQRVCDNAIKQVKHVHWTAIRSILDRFVGLEHVSLIIRGKDEWIADHIWQEIELQLRSLKRNGHSLVVRRPFCIV